MNQGEETGEAELLRIRVNDSDDLVDGEEGEKSEGGEGQEL